MYPAVQDSEKKENFFWPQIIIIFIINVTTTSYISNQLSLAKALYKHTRWLNTCQRKLIHYLKNKKREAG